MKKWINVVLPLMLVAFATSCSTTKNKPTNAQSDVAGASLAEAAASVSNSLVDLAKTEQAARHPVNTRPIPDPSTYGMGMITSTDWSGPIGPFVQKIADISSYQVKVIGAPPTIPVIVTITARNKKLGNILSDAAFQCGQRANIVVYPDANTIELRYMEGQ